MENTYLVYVLVPPEMGSEGWSCRCKFRVVEALTEDDAVLKWGELEGLAHTLEKKGDKWNTYYYEIAINKIPTTHYGRVEKLKIIDCYNACIDDKDGNYHFENKEQID